MFFHIPQPDLTSLQFNFQVVVPYYKFVLMKGDAPITKAMVSRYNRIKFTTMYKGNPKFSRTNNQVMSYYGEQRKWKRTESKKK